MRAKRKRLIEKEWEFHQESNEYLGNDEWRDMGLERIKVEERERERERERETYRKTESES